MADGEVEVEVHITTDGPIRVRGGTRLVRKAQIETEHGEPVAWATSAPLPTRDTYLLCRCGASASKPFCDGSHARVGFDGSGPADGSSPAAYAERSRAYEGTGIVVHDDRSICVHAGYCGDRLTNVWKMVHGSDDTAVRARIMAMVERCPSGALTYSVPEVDGDLEPDLAPGIGVIADGPLWVTGGLPVTSAHGADLEPRNRVTLCRCGGSANKPLCDGTHKEIGFRDDGADAGA